jgi:hypothetical protein
LEFKCKERVFHVLPKQVVSFEELLMSKVVQQEALTRLLMEKGIFTKEEFLEMVKMGADEEMKKDEQRRLSSGNPTSKNNT